MESILLKWPNGHGTILMNIVRIGLVGFPSFQGHRLSNRSKDERKIPPVTAKPLSPWHHTSAPGMKRREGENTEEAFLETFAGAPKDLALHSA